MARPRHRLGNLPAEVTSFVGRRRELGEIRKKLTTARLVSLVGPGGVGKTRLALRIAADLGRGFADGAWLVELAEVRDGALVTNAVVAALDLRDQAARKPMQILVSSLQDKWLLLVLDNCEHLLGAAAQLAAEALRAAPNVRVITTSREPLQVPGEHVVPVPPLACRAFTASQRRVKTGTVRNVVWSASVAQAVNGTSIPPQVSGANLKNRAIAKRNEANTAVRAAAVNSHVVPAERTHSRWISLLVLCTGFLLIVVDSTVVNVALPSIQRDLGFSQASLAWVVNAYLIAYGGLLLLAGRLGDLVGRKRVFLVGVAMFTAASALCGLSFSQPVLIAARFVQGIGGAVGSAVILGMVVTMFEEPAERARAMGIFAFVASAGGAIGLLAGGLITETVSWHWIFFVNLPIGLLTMGLGARLIEPDQGVGLRQGADVIGAILVTAALMLGVYTIVESDVYGLASSHTMVFGAVAIALMVAFVIRQAVVSSPLMPLRLFASRNFSGANAIQALMVAAFFGFFFLGSLYMQRVLQYGPLQIGLAFLPDTVAMAALSIGLSARFITRYGSRRVLWVGLSSIALGMLMFARSPVNADYVADLLLPMIMLGIGAGLAFTSLSMLAMADATPNDSGLASGLLNTTTQVGASLGLAILATISSEHTRDLVSRGQSTTEALSAAYHLTWAISTGLVLVCLGLAATVLEQPAPDRATPLETEDVSRVHVSA